MSGKGIRALLLVIFTGEPTPDIALHHAPRYQRVVVRQECWRKLVISRLFFLQAP